MPSVVSELAMPSVVTDDGKAPQPKANRFLVEEEFAKARLQLIEAIAKHKPHVLASCRKGSCGLWEKVENVMYDKAIGQFRGIKPYKRTRSFRMFVEKLSSTLRSVFRSTLLFIDFQSIKGPTRF